MTAYYNEIDPYAAQWLRNLIDLGQIAPGVVDERSIEDVRPDELMGFTQCHFFAGIGVWSYALRRSGWPDDRPVWTGSCPCQPFSAAGKGNGFADERHLWPAWQWLIRHARPDEVYMEQVASKDGLAWLDTVQADMEGESYAGGFDDTCAAGFGAPHIRQRLYGHFRMVNTEMQRCVRGEMGHQDCQKQTAGCQRTDEGLWLPISSGASRNGELANASNSGREHDPAQSRGDGEGEKQAEQRSESGSYMRSCRLAIPNSQRRRSWEPGSKDAGNAWKPVQTIGMADTNGNGRDQGRERIAEAGNDGAIRNGTAGWMDNGISNRRGTRGEGDNTGDDRIISDSTGPFGRVAYTDGGQFSFPVRGEEERDGTAAIGAMGHNRRPGPVNGFWEDADWLFCRDGKWRPVEPGTFPLVDGASFRMGSGSAYQGKSRAGMLKGYGNAINAEQAAGFIMATQEISA